MHKTILLLLFYSSCCLAQPSVGGLKKDSGVQFVKGLSLQQVMDKAKNEKKYIFIDAFATWCGPCKTMDKFVFSNDSVGDFMNEWFISLKIQMDRTSVDNDLVKAWYETAETFGKKYRIAEYPTYIFLSPDGMIVHKSTGAVSKPVFLKNALIALKPGQKYKDPFEEYYELLADYDAGKKDFAKMPYMVKKAIELGKVQNAQRIANEYSKYLLKFGDESILYTKDNIEFMSIVLSSRSKFFKFFYPDGRHVDAVMGKKNYARKIVDRIIMREIVDSFLQMNSGSGMKLIYGKTPQNLVEPDWNGLKKTIRKKYNVTFAKRNLIEAKINWYQQYAMVDQNIKWVIKKLKKYGIETGNEEDEGNLNWVAWEVVFYNITDRKKINAAIKWMKPIAIKDSYGMYTDTYANLLYKVGRIKEAIQWQKKALSSAVKMDDESSISQFKERLYKMENGIPTWPKPKSDNRL